MDILRTIQEFGLQSGEFIVVALLVYFLSKIFKVTLKGWSFEDPRRSALWAIIAILGSLTVIAALLLSTKPPSPQSIADLQVGRRTYTFGTVLNQSELCLIMLLPVLIIKRIRKESWESMGVSRHNLAKALSIGLTLAAAGALANLAGSQSISLVLGSLTVGHFWALLLFGAVGFTEEFMFRGFFQSRMVAWLGIWQGWIVSSLTMAFYHFFHRVGVMGMSPLDALISCATLIPISLSMGYIMIRTENVIAPAICHTFADWWGTL